MLSNIIAKNLNSVYQVSREAFDRDLRNLAGLRKRNKKKSRVPSENTASPPKKHRELRTPLLPKMSLSIARLEYGFAQKLNYGKVEWGYTWSDCLVLAPAPALGDDNVHASVPVRATT